jgi:hypothetical protein
VKYCPNPNCVHAEYEDHASKCSDCGMALVAKDALHTVETRATVAAFRAEQQREVDARVDEGSASLEDRAPGRIDFVMAAVFFAAGPIAFLGSPPDRPMRWVGLAVPLLFGIRRLAKGLAARRERRERR